jgi:hypothetical protein
MDALEAAVIAAPRALATAAVVLVLSGCAVQRASSQDAASPSSRTTSTGATAAPGCPPPMKQTAGVGIAIDYIDSFHLLGHDYLASAKPVPTTWDPGKPGIPAGHIRCTLSSYQVDPSYQLHDGDATFLPVGTAVYLVPMNNGTAEAVVSVDGRWQTYTPVANP